MWFVVMFLYGFQNGGAPLLYAVHGNHVRCVEILLGEDESLNKNITCGQRYSCVHITSKIKIKMLFKFFFV